MKRTVACIGAAVLTSCSLFGQTAPPSPAFEVASVKLVTPPPGGRLPVYMDSDAGRVAYTGVSLMNVLIRAYDVNYDRIKGPAWLESEHYDIIAKLPDGAPKEQIPAMLQNLLAERFQMTVRRETKEQSVYALVVGRDGPKLKKSDGSGASPAFAGADLRRAVVTSVTGPDGVSRMVAKGLTMSSLSDVLSRMVGRPVVDMTEIQGNYDISLEMGAGASVGMPTAVAGADATGAAAPVRESASSASIFAVIQQIGLKLESRKAPIEYIVVDKAEKVPTEN